LLSPQDCCQEAVIEAFRIALYEERAFLTQSADIAPDKVYIDALNLPIVEIPLEASSSTMDRAVLRPTLSGFPYRRWTPPGMQRYIRHLGAVSDKVAAARDASLAYLAIMRLRSAPGDDASVSTGRTSSIVSPASWPISRNDCPGHAQVR
jgi:hypothetical protein